jgi:hypothetical protein
MDGFAVAKVRSQKGSKASKPPLAQFAEIASDLKK